MIRCNFPESRLRFRVFSFSLKALVVFSTKMELKKKKKKNHFPFTIFGHEVRFGFMIVNSLIVFSSRYPN